MKNVQGMKEIQLSKRELGWYLPQDTLHDILVTSSSKISIEIQMCLQELAQHHLSS